LAHALANVPEPIRTTRPFAAVLRSVLKAEGLPTDDPEVRKTTQRCLQALRIAVNDEFGVLEQFLAFLPKALRPGGRVPSSASIPARIAV